MSVKVYFWCTTLASFIALGQLILVFGLNRRIGIPDIWFSMGDDVLVEFIIAVQFLVSHSGLRHFGYPAN